MIAPFSVYIAINVLSSFSPWNGNEVTERIVVFFTISFFVGATVLMGVALLRLILLTCSLIYKKYSSGRRKAWEEAVLTLLVALVLPIAGLALNQRIPFPVTFQSSWVYTLTVLNALFLFLPIRENRIYNCIVHVMRWACLPFSLYFFLTFLPFLPLSIPAILAAGSGFLILTPTVLFLVHLRKIGEAYKAPLPFGKYLITGIGLACFCLMPLFITLECLYQKSQIHAALDYLYEPNTSSEELLFVGNPDAVVSSLEWMRDYKNGLYYPYLTPLRNKIMLNNMVLPDDKLKRLYKTFTGKELTLNKRSNRMRGNRLFGMTSGNVHAQGRMPVARNFDHAVTLNNITSTVRDEGDFERTLYKLELQSGSTREDEYFTTIRVPEGVYVSDFYLHISNSREQGMVFEKRTTQWVYQMIRDGQRRDPSILTYTGPDTMELRVFPFSKGETRYVEIEFYSPKNMEGIIYIGDQELLLSRDDAGTCIDGGNYVLMDRAFAQSLPTVKRKPLNMVLVECIENTPSVELWHNTFKDDTLYLPYLANFEITPVSEEPLTLVDAANKTSAVLSSRLMPMRGGFDEELALRYTIADYYEKRPIHSIYFPQVWYISGSKVTNLTDKAPEWLVSEIPELYDSRTREVVVLRRGAEIVAIDPDLAINQLRFDDGVETTPIEVFDSIEARWCPIDSVSSARGANTYSDAVELWKHWYTGEYNPSLRNNLEDWISDSKTSRILIPDTGYIVVENSAQEELLRRKEKQKLNAHQALEHMETPEPKTLLLISMLIGILWFTARKRLNA